MIRKLFTTSPFTAAAAVPLFVLDPSVYIWQKPCRSSQVSRNLLLKTSGMVSALVKLPRDRSTNCSTVQRAAYWTQLGSGGDGASVIGRPPRCLRHQPDHRAGTPSWTWPFVKKCTCLNLFFSDFVQCQCTFIILFSYQFMSLVANLSLLIWIGFMFVYIAKFIGHL